MNNHAKYAEVRHLLDTGDVVFFVRLTIPQAYRQGWRGIGGYLSNLAICLAQYRAGETFDGAHEAIHCGCIIRDEDDGGLYLMEFTAGRRGAGLRRLSEVIANYTGTVVVKPLDATSKGKVRTDIVQAWLRDHRLDSYRLVGLAFPTLNHVRGWAWRGAMFCSEAVISLLQRLEVVPVARPVLRGCRMIMDRIMPHWYSPKEVWNLPQLDGSEAIVFNGGLRDVGKSQ
ncbi:MAG TPA: hypothetical protein VLH56_19270 [Dissulfurispiraceae bacterium]|nr:hypothetical protein [Dissulfurispiraceae bacterium]